MAPKENAITTEDGTQHPVPKAVKEQATGKTSIYQQGRLIYDGATGTYVGEEGMSAASRYGIGPGASLNEMLKWSIENSDPSELARRAGDGAKPPSQIDREILDMLMGEPIVAKMRECLFKLSSSALCGSGGLDDACAALEELEYYAEDFDHAIDLAKIGGLPVLKRCAAFGLLDASESAEAAEEAAAAAANPDDAAAVREAACGVLAAAMQNNPKVERAASAQGIQTVLLAMLKGVSGAGAERIGGVAVTRKALLALSALLRTCVDDPGEAAEAPKERKIEAAALAEAAAAVEAEAAQAAAALAVGKQAAVDAALPTLCMLSTHDDLKTRRRTVFLLASLAASMPYAATAIARFAAAAASPAGNEATDVSDDAAATPPIPPLLAGLIEGIPADDEDVRTQTARLLTSIMRASRATDPANEDAKAAAAEAAADLARKLKAGGGVEAVGKAIKSNGEAGADADPEEATRLRVIQAWLTK